MSGEEAMFRGLSNREDENAPSHAFLPCGIHLRLSLIKRLMSSCIGISQIAPSAEREQERAGLYLAG